MRNSEILNISHFLMVFKPLRGSKAIKFGEYLLRSVLATGYQPAFCTYTRRRNRLPFGSLATLHVTRHSSVILVICNVAKFPKGSRFRRRVYIRVRNRPRFQTKSFETSKPTTTFKSFESCSKRFEVFVIYIDSKRFEALQIPSLCVAHSTQINFY